MKRKTKSTYWGMEATTSSRDWGYTPVPGKGGKTLNVEIPETIFKRELKEMGANA